MSIRQRLSDIFWSVVGNAVSAGLAALVAAVWAAFEVAALDVDLGWGLGWPLAIFAGLVVFGSVVMGWGQLLQIYDRQKRLTPPTAEEIEKRITDWMLNSGYNIKDLGNQHPESDFALGTVAADNIRVLVIKPSDKGFVFVTSAYEIPEKKRRVLSEAAPLFEHDVVRDLFLLGAQRRLEHDDQGRLSIVEVHQHVVFSESTTTFDFLNDHLLVRRGIKLVQRKVQRTVDEHRLEEQADDGAIGDG